VLCLCQSAYEEYRVILFGGYFDESTDENSIGACYTVAGYMGNGRACVTLDLRWKDILDKHEMKYYKASEVESGWGEFRKFRENPKGPLTERDRKKQLEIRTDFLDLLCDDDALIGISASVLIQDWDTFCGDEPELRKRLPPNLYTLCSQIMLMESGLSAYDHNMQVSRKNQILLRPIFDSHYEYEPRFRAAYPEHAKKNPRSTKYLLDPMYENEEDYRCLQAADLLAYEVRLNVAAYARRPDYVIRIAMERLLSKQRVMYVLDYDGLKRLAEQQPTDLVGFDPIYRSKTNRPARRH
jgi:hypothetical protein